MAGLDTTDDEIWIRRALLAMADWSEYTARALGGGVQVWDDAHASDARSACPFFNNAVLRRPLEPDSVDDLVERLDRFFGIGAGGPWLLWSGWPTPELTPRGFLFWGEPPVMLRPPGGEPPPMPPELRIEEVHDAAGLLDHERVLTDGFPLSWVQPYRPNCLLDARVLGGPLRFWVGYAEGRPVSTSAASVHEETVAVFNIATLPEARGRGYGAALTWAATQAEPALPALLESSDLGRPIYERLGYRIVRRLSLWERARG